MKFPHEFFAHRTGYYARRSTVYPPVPPAGVSALAERRRLQLEAVRADLEHDIVEAESAASQLLAARKKLKQQKVLEGKEQIIKESDSEVNKEQDKYENPPFPALKCGEDFSSLFCNMQFSEEVPNNDFNSHLGDGQVSGIELVLTPFKFAEPQEVPAREVVVQTMKLAEKCYPEMVDLNNNNHEKVLRELKTTLRRLQTLPSEEISVIYATESEDDMYDDLDEDDY